MTVVFAALWIRRTIFWLRETINNKSPFIQNLSVVRALSSFQARALQDAIKGENNH